MVDGSYILYNDKLKKPLLTTKNSKNNICLVIYNWFFKKSNNNKEKHKVTFSDTSHIIEEPDNINYDDIFKDSS